MASADEYSKGDIRIVCCIGVGVLWLVAVIMLCEGVMPAFVPEYAASKEILRLLR